MSLAIGFCLIATFTWAQKIVKLEVEPNPSILETNTSLQLKIIAKDQDGNILKETQNQFFAVQLKGVEQNVYIRRGV